MSETPTQAEIEQQRKDAGHTRFCVPVEEFEKLKMQLDEAKRNLLKIIGACQSHSGASKLHIRKIAESAIAALPSEP